MARPYLPLLALAACYDPGYTDATRCGPAGECPAGRRCAGDVCVASDAATGPRLILDKAAGATGTGRVTARFLDCPGTCTHAETALTGDQVVLTALPDPGSFFQGWSGACVGPYRRCTVTGGGVQGVEARFSAMTHNLVFATEASVDGDFGGAEAGDAMCAAAAEEAGLSGPFVAFLGRTGGPAAPGRLVLPGTSTPARGFMRLDGEPVADRVEDLTLSNRVWNAVAFDQNGQLHEGPVWTGTELLGAPSPFNCLGWSDNTSGYFGVSGHASAGPRFNVTGATECNLAASVYCFGVGKNLPLAAPAPAAGKLIFVTHATLPARSSAGYQTAQDLCDAEGNLPAVRALLATQGQRASRFLVAGATYVRPDGVIVGTGSEIMGGELRSGVWQESDGTYSVAAGVWTGSGSVGALEQFAQPSCGSWTTTTGMGVVGSLESHATRWWFTGNEDCSDVDTYAVYCVEP